MKIHIIEHQVGERILGILNGRASGGEAKKQYQDSQPAQDSHIL